MVGQTCFRSLKVFNALQTPIDQGSPWQIPPDAEDRIRATKLFKAENRKRIDEKIDALWKKFLSLQLELEYDVWKDHEVDYIIGFVLDQSLSALSTRDPQEIELVINWMFVGAERLMRDGSGAIYWAPTKLVPFSFEFCCRYIGYDPETLREQTLIDALAFQQELWKEIVSTGGNHTPVGRSISLIKSALDRL